MWDPTGSRQKFISYDDSIFHENLCDNTNETGVCGNVLDICFLSELTINLTDEVKMFKKCW